MLESVVTDAPCAHSIDAAGRRHARLAPPDSGCGDHAQLQTGDATRVPAGGLARDDSPSGADRRQSSPSASGRLVPLRERDDQLEPCTQVPRQGCAYSPSTSARRATPPGASSPGRISYDTLLDSDGRGAAYGVLACRHLLVDAPAGSRARYRRVPPRCSRHRRRCCEQRSGYLLAFTGPVRAPIARNVHRARRAFSCTRARPQGPAAVLYHAGRVATTWCSARRRPAGRSSCRAVPSARARPADIAAGLVVIVSVWDCWSAARFRPHLRAPSRGVA